MKINILLISQLLIITLSRPIINNCSTFSEAGFCVECKSSYILVDGRCKKKFQIDNPKCFNCVNCINDKCHECEDQFELRNNTCVLTICTEYDNCNICDETKCLICEDGYLLNKRFCFKESFTNVSMILYIVCPIILFIFNVVICVVIKIKLTKHHPSINISETKKDTKVVVLKNYIIPEKTIAVQNVNGSFNAFNHSFNSINDNPLEPKHYITSSFNIHLKDLKTCIKCNSNKITAILDCGCELCFKHFLEFAKVSNKKCTIHNHNISIYYLKQHFNSKDNCENEIDNGNNSICSICKAKIGYINLNCECGARLCNNCFNELILMVNYYQCPICQVIISN